ncbi:MAG: DMT family transporter [Geminicoccales bacterium]
MIGSCWMLVLAGCTALDAAVIRIVGQTIHPFEIGFFRVLFALLLVSPWLIQRGLADLRSDFLLVHASRAILKLLAQIAYFYAVLVMPLADVAAIGFAKPLFVSIGAVLFLGEVMRLRRWVAIAIGFLGVVVILRPGSTLFDPWIMSAVFAAIGLAGVNLLMKYLAEREATNRILAWNLMISVPVALVLALPFWTTPSLPILGLLLLQGGLGALAQFSAARAMRLADVSVLTAIEFVRLPLVALIAYVLFGEISGFWTWMGAAIIIGSTLYLVRREAKLGRQDSVSSRHEG